MLFRVFFIVAVLIGSAVIASAQRDTNMSPTNPLTGESNPVEEMRAKWEIKIAEKQRKENVGRAREAAQLSSEIQVAYSRNQVFSENERKRLERLEKVTRKIRSEAGGSDGDVTIDNMPSQLEPALKRLAELSDQMRQAVEDTPRQVVSASVIEHANEVLELIRYVKSFTH